MPETTLENIPIACQQVQQQVWDYIDDRLMPDARTLVQAHMDECSRCSRYRVFQERCRARLGARRDSRPAPWHVKARILDALAAAGYAPR